MLDEKTCCRCRMPTQVSGSSVIASSCFGLPWITWPAKTVSRSESSTAKEKFCVKRRAN